MKLLIERVEEVQYLNEDVEGSKKLYIVGPYLQAEQKNRNGRIYPKNILEREVARYIKEKVNRNCAWGELGHPESPTINLDRVSHRIVSLKEDGNNWIGKAQVEDTPHGNIIRSLIAGGGILGISTRGVGTLKMVEGANMVQDDYHLATAGDVVADPSAPDAYLDGLMEQKDWVWSNGIIQEADIAKIYHEVKNTKRKDLEEATLRAFRSFIEKL